MLTKSKSLALLVISKGNHRCQPASFRRNKLHSLSLSARSVAVIRPIQMHRYASSTPNQPSKPTTQAIGNQQNGGDHGNHQKSWKFVNYTFAVAIGSVAGLITGYILVTDSKQLDNVNELSRSLMQSAAFEPTKFVSRLLE